MVSELLVATHHGLLTCMRQGGEWQVVADSLKPSHVTCVIAREGVILAGTTRGVFRSDDGRHWSPKNGGLSIQHVRWLAFNPDHSDFEFAGTEPASIFVSHDGGNSWRECDEVAALRNTYNWSLPYSPNAGCVRGFAFRGSRAFAAVEVGGLLRSEDAGESWHLAEGSNGIPDLHGPPEPLIYPDVHSIVALDGGDAVTLYAPTGGGLYRSNDSGKSWKLIYECYCRALWVDPGDARHLVFGPAEGVSSGGRIEESRDGGETWVLASKGLRVPWADDMVERFAQAGDELFAVMAGGQVYMASPNSLEWKRVLPDVEEATCLTTMY